MKISVNGKRQDEMISHLTDLYEDKFEIVKTNIETTNFPVVDYVASSFKHVNTPNVIYSGGVFDNYQYFEDDGKDDVQEQLILSYINNVDKIVVVIDDMSQKLIETINSYKKLFPEKIDIYAFDNPVGN